jgi:mannose-6-phosphate isomerase-like protein (cupin superfamily)
MKHVKLRGKRPAFKVLLESASAQAATMILAPGESTGEPDNEHPKCEQWLYVVSGRGTVLAGGKRKPIEAGSLVLIEKREVHQVTATGDQPLVTFNVYVPPAYTPGSEPKRSAR